MRKDMILVVDDDKRWHFWIARALGDSYDLRFALDSTGALDLIRSVPFALAILDQRLGPVSGIDLLDQLRASQRDLPAIILTGYPDVEHADIGIMKGVAGYLTKGDPPRLRERVASVLANHNPIAALIRRGESDELEFKSSARWDMKLQRVNKEIEGVIVKTVAGFLNSNQGGVLLIGVGDDGVPVGLQHDYDSLGRHKDRDGFQAFLVQLLSDAYGKDVSAFLYIDFHQFGDKDVCRVSARPAAHEVYVEDDKFFLRIGNTTQRLSTREANEYCRVRWPHPTP
jgi:ActR/RegA family two-component response regulator